jgi:hypothetical protein
MQFDRVQTSLEAYIQSIWTTTTISFENIAFNSDMYDEFVAMRVVFGDTVQRSITGCYRVMGLLILSIYVRPATGVSQALVYADQLSALLVAAQISPVPPHTAPVVQLIAPDLYKGAKEENGWVKVQLSCPFHYDLEI